MTAAERIEEESPGLAEGTLVDGRFRVGALLGRGGMGAVYAAEDERIGRQVALKVLTVRGRASLARFQAEARAASRISSRHVAAVHDFGTDEEHDVSYLVLERLDGHTLEEVMALESRLDPSTAAAIGADIAEALSAAHAADVVHRDLKPSNVWMLREGGVKVIDFGIARVQTAVEGSSITAPNTILGTPRYISPEAVDGKRVGPPADLYALGVILFEMVSGCVPFDDELPVLICGKHLTEPPPLIRDVAPDAEVPEAYQDLVSALLEKDPRRRPPSALEVAEQLRALSDVEGAVRISGVAITPTAVTAEVSRRPPPMPARRAWLLPALAALIGVALVLGVATVVLWSDPEPAIEATPEPTEPTPEPNPEARETDPEPDPPEPPLAPPQPPDLTISVDLFPAGATLLLDGEAVDAPFEVSPDGAEHVLEARARGYRTARVTFVADHDQTVELRLAPRGRSSGSEVPQVQDRW